MPRVHEIAKELGVTSREVIDELNALGHSVTSHASSVGDEAAADLRAKLGNGEANQAAPGESAARTSAVTPAEIPEPADVPEPAPVSEPAAPTTVARTAPPLPEREPERRRRSRLTRQLMELPLLIGLAFVIAVVIKTFVAQAFFIPSPSMRPTLVQGDRVLVEKISYRFRSPQRGHVVVFAKEVFGATQDVPWHQDARNFLRELLGLPTGREEDYIKRVVAVGGDIVRYAGKPRQLEVNGELVDEPYIRGGRDPNSQALKAGDCERLEMEAQDGGCIVPAGRVFVMGDNRANSEDSRVIGPIEQSKIVGRAFVVIWPFGNWGGL